MSVLLIAILIGVAAVGTAVVFTRDVRAQPIGISFFGLVLAIMFMAFQAPDVALSQLVIGAVGLPLMILLALAKLRRDEDIQKKKRTEGKS
jgi:energy-converting hydrogenase B subunit D